jgi:hypothetical protein
LHDEVRDKVAWTLPCCTHSAGKNERRFPDAVQREAVRR